MGKLSALFGLVLAAGAWISGALNFGYARVVQRPPADVMAALEDLDITAQPGAPGTDPNAAGGVKPLFRLAKGPNAMTWYVMSGDQVATRMTASFEPLNNGTETKVTTSVERGDAPDDRVSPAFRSVGITKGLFSMAVEGELNKLTRPPVTKTAEECQEIFIRDMAGVNNEGKTLGEAIGRTAMATMRLSAARDHMRQAGCDVDGGEQTPKSISAKMQPAASAGSEHASPSSNAFGHDNPIRFEPGKPMVDLSRR